MFKFDKKQEVFEVGGVKVGGQPGEYPTVLIGTMFYNRHKIVTNEDTGEFDKGAADSLWNDMQEMGDVTGNPYINQIVGETPEAIKKFIDWFVEVDDKTPFLIDSSAGDVRSAAADYVTEIGVAKRAIHNSINSSVHEDEIEAITRSGMDAAIVLAFNATDPSVKGKLEILEVGGTGQDKGMLEIAKECGITKPLIDVCRNPTWCRCRRNDPCCYNCKRPSRSSGRSRIPQHGICMGLDEEVQERTQRRLHAC